MSNLERNKPENIDNEKNDFERKPTSYNPNYMRNKNYIPNKMDDRTRKILIFSIIGFFIVLFLFSVLAGMIVYMANPSQYST